MKAVLEYWVPKIREFEREDEMIVRNAFEFNGMGVPIQSVLVTGERVPAGEAGDALYHYKFLWIIEPMVTPTLGVTGSYPCALRPTMSGLSRLRKAEIVYYDEDVQDMKRAMHAEFEQNSNVKFIKEFFYCKDCPSRLDDRVRRKLEDANTFVPDPGKAMTEPIPEADRVAKDVSEWSQSILRHWTQLNWFIRYHEQTIRSRWCKRTHKRRKLLLLKVWPNMPLSRRPDISADRQRQSSRGVLCERAAFLWQPINLEALVAETPLLVFLNARGRHPPHSFIAADCAWAGFGVKTGNIHKVTLDDYDLVFANGTENGYGKLSLATGFLV
ncbi:hypothetical protein N7471_010475 [Penicillium samsonianum]|uniref:uncharacterized protein n=1 Tax=Penicillium samsonianum TaxID=1882272 RepID=UPI0025480C38|nr:uncharacterized protein N7471_010475 [Penicillium samsonianum]KAJ6125982.1 hypothetical protein N7471_010475 [Penicillium samsonianum]